MDSRFGFMFVLLTLFLRIDLAYSSIDITDLLPVKCRTAGVLLIEKKMNYTMSELVCEALGLRLASRADIQKAWRFGYETCSYGWVTEKYVVISRIQNNKNCGQNRTGVLTWTVPLSREFNAYCFNASDLQINSCKPGLMVTIPPSTTKPMTVSPLPETTRPQIPETQGNTTAWTSSLTTSSLTTSSLTTSSLTTTSKSTSRPSLTTLITAPKTSPKETPPATTQVMTTAPSTEEPTKPTGNQAARQSEKTVFGKLPTTLLILALVFFIAAVVLAICYIKKYKTSMFFSKIKEEKEFVETNTFNETATANNTKEEETTANGKEGKPQGLEANTGVSMEVEV